MHFSCSAAVRVTIGFLLAVGLLNTGFARERGPRVEVVCPFPPIPVTIDKQKVLAYELHITNFDTVPLTLKRAEIFANEEGNGPLGALADESLSAAMTRVGAAMIHTNSGNGSKDTRVIEPGGRNVVFLWVELSSNLPMPVRLMHRVVFSFGR